MNKKKFKCLLKEQEEIEREALLAADPRIPRGVRHRSIVGPENLYYMFPPKQTPDLIFANQNFL